MPDRNPHLLGTIVSDLVFRVTGFGPSQSICLPFAEKVYDEAEAVNAPIRFDLP